MTNDSPPSALDELLERVTSQLHLARRDIEGRIAPIESALKAYRRALEDAAASKYSTDHSLTRPSTAGLSVEKAAEQLLTSVRQLPELESDLAAGETPANLRATVPPSRSAPPAAAPAKPTAPPATAPAKPTAQPSSPTAARPLASALPRVAAATKEKRLVIIGALAGRKKPLPAPLDSTTDWIDTGSGGAHASGNLPTRIRQGRVFGVIICDQAISHKHSEPVVAAARSAGVPVGFAGKGGSAGIARALEAIEDQL